VHACTGVEVTHHGGTETFDACVIATAYAIERAAAARSLSPHGRIGHLYDTDHTRIRIGMLIVMLAALVFIPFAAVVSQFIARVEGGAGVLTYTFLLGATGNIAARRRSASARPMREHTPPSGTDSTGVI